MLMIVITVTVELMLCFGSSYAMMLGLCCTSRLGDRTDVALEISSSQRFLSEDIR